MVRSYFLQYFMYYFIRYYKGYFMDLIKVKFNFVVGEKVYEKPLNGMREGIIIKRRS